MEINISDDSKEHFEKIKREFIESMKTIPEENRTEVMMAMNLLMRDWYIAKLDGV